MRPTHCVVAHVAFGALQSEKSPWLACLVAASMGTADRTAPSGREPGASQGSRATPAQRGGDGFVDVCDAASIPDQRATVVTLGSERVAVFRYDGRVSAVSNVCRHQNGPLGEGQIIDGCITCPWHGYQYRPECGSSPPPFTDKIPTFQVRVEHGKVFVHPQALSPGTRVEPAIIGQETGARLA